MTVNEDLYIQRCPKCGNTDLHVQVPIALATPKPCAECAENPWKEAGFYDVILHYTCMHCHINYLTPKIEQEDKEIQLFDSI